VAYSISFRTIPGIVVIWTGRVETGATIDQPNLKHTTSAFAGYSRHETQQLHLFDIIRHKMNGIANLNLNGDDPSELESLPPVQLAFTLPSSPDTRVHLQMTDAAKSLLLFISNTTVGAPSSGASLGNLVFAMPNVRVNLLIAGNTVSD
jgi:hypothetical protein